MGLVWPSGPGSGRLPGVVLAGRAMYMARARKLAMPMHFSKARTWEMQVVNLLDSRLPKLFGAFPIRNQVWPAWSGLAALARLALAMHFPTACTRKARREPLNFMNFKSRLLLQICVARFFTSNRV